MAPPVAPSNHRIAYRQTATTQRLTMEPYSWYKFMGAGKPIRSKPFTLGGHPWSIFFYPGGSYPKSPYVAVFLRLETNLIMEQLRVVVDFTLVDDCATGGSDVYTRQARHTFRQDAEISCGFAEYLRKYDLESSGSLRRRDRLVLECAVRLVEDGEELRPPAPSPSALQRDLRRMLEDGVGSDVTIVAGGQRFRAHRCVLAARSPVLRAQLCGPIRDGRDVIELPDDVAPDVLAALLGFIYGDALPATTGDDKEADARMAQRLLVAADLYALDGLGRACQDMLCRCVTPCTAADTYALAERLNLPRVKAAVIEALAVCPDGKEAVEGSAGFEQLAAEDAALAKEIMSKLKTARYENPVRASVSREEVLVTSLSLIVLVVAIPSVVFYFTR